MKRSSQHSEDDPLKINFETYERYPLEDFFLQNLKCQIIIQYINRDKTENLFLEQAVYFKLQSNQIQIIQNYT